MSRMGYQLTLGTRETRVPLVPNKYIVNYELSQFSISLARIYFNKQIMKR